VKVAVSTQRFRRDATRVIYEILLLGINGASKTHIIFKANLSYQLAERYVAFLMKKGLLATDSDPSGLVKYYLTEKGHRLIRVLREVERELADLYSMTLSSETRVLRQSSQIYRTFDN